jgi:hypothetical protein
MKTLLNADDKTEIVRRIGLVNSASHRLWGTMTASQMICHLSDAFRVTLGDKSAKPVRNRYSSRPMKWLALWFPRQWPHGVPTVPECDSKQDGTPPAEFVRDKSELLELFDRFTRQSSGLEQLAHPFFGPMTEKEWMRWGYLHADHHLRQFGA